MLPDQESGGGGWGLRDTTLVENSDDYGIAARCGVKKHLKIRLPPSFQDVLKPPTGFMGPCLILVLVALTLTLTPSLRIMI